MTVLAEACTCEVEGRKDCPACASYEQLKSDLRRSARIERSEMPRGLQRKSFLAFEDGPGTAAARAWATGEKPGLCLTGTVGVTKTWLAAAAAWERLQNHPLQWVSVARMMSQLRSGFGSEAKKQADRILTGKGSIVLDDLDKANATDFGREVVFCAIDGRMDEGASILITTNKALSQIASLYGAPVASRLAGYCQIVEMTGADRRLS